VVKLVDLDHGWAHEIGRIFIAFGSIEYTVHTLLHDLPKDPIHKSTAGLPLGQKIELLVAILDSRAGAKEGAMSRLLTKVKPLAEERNLIAHNPLALDVYMTSEGEPMLRETIRSLRKLHKHVSFDDVAQLREASETLAYDLLNAQLALSPTSRGTS
jgi:hypothetical protein